MIVESDREIILEDFLYGTTTFLAYFSSYQTWAAFIFGAIVGSFLNVCILRIPAGSFWENSRSVCPTCNAPIPFYLNIPLFSYVFLKAKTQCCQQKLSWQYPIVEAFTGVMFAVLFWKFPFVYEDRGHYLFDAKEMIRYVHGSILISVLIVCSVIDFHLKIIPDVISLPMILLSPLVVYFHPELTWQSSLIGVLVGGGILFAVAWIYWVVRNQVGMGMGDVKLLAAIGGWLGYQAVLPTVFYGSILGSLVGVLGLMLTRNMSLSSKIPFGPFLAIGAIVHLLFGMQLQEFLLRG
jgi:leader peptidase (prepilin peptidase)/N-methyltransferase